MCVCVCTVVVFNDINEQWIISSEVANERVENRNSQRLLLSSLMVDQQGKLICFGLLSIGIMSNDPALPCVSRPVKAGAR